MPNTAEVQIQIRRGVAADWTSADPTLLSGEIGYETDTGFIKWGDGATAWTSLAYDKFFGGDVDIAGDAIIQGGIILGDAVIGDIRLTVDDKYLRITGSNDAESGAQIRMFGGTHSGTPSDFSFTSDENEWMGWDESAGIFAVNTGAGVKTNALTIDSSQIPTFAGASFVMNNYTFDADQTVGASEDGYTLTYNDATGEILLSPSSGGGMITGAYRFDTSTATGPSSSDIRFDTGDYGTVTELFISDTTFEGSDATNFLAALQAGDQIYIQETADAGTFSVWEVSAAVTDETGWFRVPVTEIANGVFPGNNDKLTLALSYTSANAGVDWKAGTEPGFHSLGIDDNTTAERLSLSDTNAQWGVLGADFAHINVANDEALIISGGSSTGNGANMYMYGGAHSFAANDHIFRAGSNTWQQWDEGNGEWTLRTGLGVKTQAILVNNLQAATFAGDVNVQGAFTSIGIDDNATFETLELADASATIGKGSDGYQLFIGDGSTTTGNVFVEIGNARTDNGAAVIDFKTASAGDYNLRLLRSSGANGGTTIDHLGTGSLIIKTNGSNALTFNSSQRATFDGTIQVESIIQNTIDTTSTYLSGGNTQAKGGNARLYGSTEATNPGDVELRSDANTFLHWDESAGDLEILTGVGVKSTALTINSSQVATFAGNVTVTSGLFTSRGIDDNATVERIQVDDTVVRFGGSLEDFLLHRPINTGTLVVAGGNTGTAGGNMKVWGQTHATRLGDLELRSAANAFLVWDETVGDLEILTGIGAKTSALTIDLNQVATFAGQVNIGGYFKPAQATDTELNDITDAINTDAGKEQGVMVYNTTTDNPVYAVGNADGSVWVDGAGATVNTPV